MTCAARSHSAIENKLHWVLDTTFKEDQSRLRVGHGAKNMAVVRHFALNLVHQANEKRSIKRRRKRASYDLQYLLEILGPDASLTSTRCPDDKSCDDVTNLLHGRNARRAGGRGLGRARDEGDQKSPLGRSRVSLATPGFKSWATANR